MGCGNPYLVAAEFEANFFFLKLPRG